MKANLYEIDRRMDLLREHIDILFEQHPDFEEKLEVSWIYHENALEGVVLTHDEIQSALENQPVPDISLGPVYEDVRCHKRVILHFRKLAQRKRVAMSLDLVKKVHGMFFEKDDPKGSGRYRRDMPIHRSYFHEIAQPDKIAPRMRQLFDWVESQEARRTHPVKLGGTIHYELMRINPFSQHTGKVARMLMNYVLLQNGYLPAIIHAVERQRYYDCLRMPSAVSIALVMEALENSIQSALKLLGPEHEKARAAS